MKLWQSGDPCNASAAVSPMECTSCFLLGDRIIAAMFGRLCVIRNARNFGIVFCLINYNELAIVAESLGLREPSSRAEPHEEGRGDAV